MSKGLISVTVPMKVAFYDVDSMGVVWHGNYVKFLEVARCALLDKIGYGYNEMKAAGVAFPVITMDLKFVKSLVFDEEATIETSLTGYKDFLTITYVIKNVAGEVCLKASSKQVAVKWGESGHETLYQSPEQFTRLVEAALAKEALK